MFEEAMKTLPKLDLYIILKASWPELKKRMLKRARPEELQNFDSNEQYFKELAETYHKEIVRLSEEYDINYIVIDTDYLTSEDVYEEVLESIEL
jgi:deoxyadenosine/deoxycytidine kinase